MAVQSHKLKCDHGLKFYPLPAIHEMNKRIAYMQGIVSKKHKISELEKMYFSSQAPRMKVAALVDTNSIYSSEFIVIYDKRSRLYDGFITITNFSEPKRIIDLNLVGKYFGRLRPAGLLGHGETELMSNGPKLAFELDLKR